MNGYERYNFSPRPKLDFCKCGKDWPDFYINFTETGNNEYSVRCLNCGRHTALYRETVQEGVKRAAEAWNSGLILEGEMEDSKQGNKYDTGKLRLDLIPPEVIEMLGAIYTYGAEKYGENTWDKNINEARFIAAARRHDLAMAKGEVIDPESGLPHAAHAAWNYLTTEVLRMRGSNPRRRGKQ